jgi:hypothetical protein
VVDLVAAGVAIWLAGKLADHDIAPILKGLIGAICGLAAELGRWAVLAGVQQVIAFGDAPSGWVVWLAALRLWNIPILAGLGFLAGSNAGASKSVSCPKCNKAFILNVAQIKAAAGSTLDMPYRCPLCKTMLMLDCVNFVVLGLAPAEEPQAGAQADGAAAGLG